MKPLTQHSNHTKRPVASTQRKNPPESNISQNNINPISSINIKSLDASIPSEGDRDDVTSNDTIPVSNETEAELTVNETGPGYFDFKNAFSANTTQDLDEFPRNKEDGPKNGINGDVSVGKYYNGAAKEPTESQSVGTEYSNEVKEKEHPEQLHFEVKDHSHSSESLELSNSQKLLVKSHHMGLTAGGQTTNRDSNNKVILKTGSSKENITSPMKHLNHFNQHTEFNPFAKVGDLSNAKGESEFQNSKVDDLGARKATFLNEKLKGQDNAKFAKILKRVGRVLRRSQISSHNDLRRVQELVRDLGHLVPTNSNPVGNDSSMLMVDAAKGIDLHLSTIEKRMHVASGNEILNNINTVLVQLFEKIQNSDDKAGNVERHKEEVSTTQKVLNTHGRNPLEMKDMVQRMKHLEKVFQRHLKKERLTKCKAASSVLHKVTLTAGVRNLKHNFYGTVTTMAQCIARCCDNKWCDLALLNTNGCYGVDCKHESCLLAPDGKSTGSTSVALLTKRISAKIGFTGTPNGKVPTDQCKVQPHVITDSVLGQGGLKGNATVLDNIPDTWSCGVECCKTTTCNVAMIQDKVCYIISCSSDGPCFDFEHSLGHKTSLAFVKRSKSRVPVLQPSLPSLKLKSMSSATNLLVTKSIPKPGLSSIFQLPRPSSTQTYSSLTLTRKVESSDYSFYGNKQISSELNDIDSSMSSTYNNPKSIHAHKTPSVSKYNDLPNKCVQTFPLSNVTLRAKFSAGNFNFQGKVKNTSICVDHCCRNDNCNVAFVLQSLCFLVTCTSNIDCENEPLLTSAFDSSLVYVARTPFEADMVKQELVPTLKPKISDRSRKSKTHTKSRGIKKANDSNIQTIPSRTQCSIGFIASNAKLLHGFESGEVTVIGKLKGGINECISRCCGYTGCNASFVITGQCFLVKCYSRESCQIVESDSKFETSVAVVNRQSDHNPLSYLSAQKPVMKVTYRNGSTVSQASKNISDRKKYYPEDLLDNHSLSPTGQQSSDNESFGSKIGPSLASISNNHVFAKTNSHAKDASHELSTSVKIFGSKTNHSGGNKGLLHESKAPNQASLISFASNTVHETNYSGDARRLGEDSKTPTNEFGKESIEENDGKNLGNSEIVRKIMNGLDNLLLANRKPQTKEAGYNEIHHGSKSKLNTHGVNDDDTNDSRKFKPDLIGSVKSAVSAGDKKKASSDMTTSKIQGRVKEVESDPKSEIVGKISYDKGNEMAGAQASVIDELVSKMKNLSLEQKQLKNNIPNFDEIVGKIQQHLESKSGATGTEDDRVERKDAITNNKSFNDSTSLKEFLKTPLPQNNYLLPKTAITPTPKLVHSPVTLITKPSMTDKQAVRSTTYKSSTLPKLSVPGRVESIHTKAENDIGKEILMALKSAGLIPTKIIPTHSSSSKLNTQVREHKINLNEAKKAKVSAAQRLVNFLEEQIRLKTAHLANYEKRNHATKAGEETNSSEREMNALNERIKHLESVVHQLKSNKNSLRKTIAASDLLLHDRNENRKEDRKENSLPSSGKTAKESDIQVNKKYLVEQLQDIIQSEISQKSIAASATSTGIHSTQAKLIDDTSDANAHEVVLEHNLNRLYSHAVDEMEKALDSSGRDEHERKLNGGEHLSYENVKKNKINVKKAGLLANKNNVIVSTKSNNPELLDIALEKSKPKADKSGFESDPLSHKEISTSTKKKKGTRLGNSRKDESVDIVNNHVVHGDVASSSSKDRGNVKNVNIPFKGKVEKPMEFLSQQSAKGLSNHNAPKCRHSQVQYDVTLRGGIAREGARDGEIVKDISECIELCCRSTSCDVAFMLKDNCFLLPCTDTQLCQAVDLPTKSLKTKLAFVSRDSKANVQLKMFDDVVNGLGTYSVAKMQKSALGSQIKKNELPSPVNAANADETDQLGKRKSIKKLSGRDNSNNLTVQALLKEVDSIASQTGLMENGLSKTSSKLHLQPQAKPKKNMSTLQKLPVKQKFCPYSEVEHNTTIKGGLPAVEYKYVGNLASINGCVEKCCEFSSCNIAFMVSNECFLLVCNSPNQCKSVPASSSRFSTTMVRLLRNGFGTDAQKPAGPDEELKEALETKKALVPSREKLGKKKSGNNEKEHLTAECMKSEPVHHVVPNGGMISGNYKDFGQVRSLRECVDYCCQWKKCTMAFMVLDGCFGVSCPNDCHLVPSKDSSYQSKVVYVKRHRDVLHWLNTQGSSRSFVPGVEIHSDKKEHSVLNTKEDKHIHRNNKFEKKTGLKTEESESVDHGKETEAKRRKSSTNSKVEAVSEDPKTSDNKRWHTNVEGQIVSDTNNSAETISKDKRGDGMRPQINVKAAVEPKLSSGDDEKGLCIPGAVEHDVTLGGGIKAGSYTEQGEVVNMKECIEWCCKERKCDVAMLIKGICYTVSCYDQRKCVSVPVRRIQYHPSLVHVRRVKRNMAHGVDTGRSGDEVSMDEVVDETSGSSIDHRDLNGDNGKYEHEKSSIEDELVDLLTEQSPTESIKFQTEKGEITTIIWSLNTLSGFWFQMMKTFAEPSHVSYNFLQQL